MTDTLSPERVAEIRAQLPPNAEIYGSHQFVFIARTLLASHEALRAENDAMRAQIEASQMRRLEIGDDIKDRLAQKLADAELTTARDTAAREMRWIATERSLPHAENFLLGNKAEYGKKFRWEVDDSVTYWVFEGGLSWFCRLAIDGREEWTKQCSTKDEAMRCAETDALPLPSETKERGS